MMERRSLILLAAILPALVVAAACSRSVYYGVSARDSASWSVLVPTVREGNILSYNLFFVTHVDSEPIAFSQVTGTAGLRLHLDDTEHTVTIVASHPTLADQTVATAVIVFRPSPGREYVPGGVLESENWALWVADKATGDPVSAVVKVPARKTGPIEGPDIGPIIGTMVR